jgi:hypothetical protein
MFDVFSLRARQIIAFSSQNTCEHPMLRLTVLVVGDARTKGPSADPALFPERIRTEQVLTRGELKGVCLRKGSRIVALGASRGTDFTFLVTNIGV